MSDDQPPTELDSTPVVTDAQWVSLVAAAVDAATAAYCPYSNFPVGAAGLTDTGEVVTGCNVENASYGLTLCAECGLISDLVRRGAGRLVALVACNPAGTPVAPCGRCRQLLREHGTPDVAVRTPDGPRPLAELLPWSFGPEWLTDQA